MGFRTKRGRPKKPGGTLHDYGTVELQRQRAAQATLEPLDQLLAHGHLRPHEHQAGMHFRWLYTLCYGAPLPGSIHAGIRPADALRTDSEHWRAEREAEYRTAALLLHGRGWLRCVQNCCLYHELPPDGAQIARVQRGLQLLSDVWGLKPSRGDTATPLTTAGRCLS